MRILFFFLMMVILMLSFNAFYHHKHSTQTANAYKCTYPHTTLYVYMEPVQKECVLLMHNGHVINAEGAADKIREEETTFYFSVGWKSLPTTSFHSKNGPAIELAITTKEVGARSIDVIYLMYLV